MKTKDRLSVSLAPFARVVLARYEGKLPEVMSNQKTNDYLKELCQLGGIDEPVQKVRYVGSTRIEGAQIRNATIPRGVLLSPWHWKEVLDLK